LKLCTILSYRQAVETMNRLLHRNHQKEIKQKTYADFCIRTGKKMEEETNQKAFRPYSIILDWYHLKKRCQEYLSMSVTGGKQKRNEILQKLLRILWAGNVDEAIHYLSTLPDSSLRPQNRIQDLCAYFEKNRVCIPCYTLRSIFHLKNSSNRVEKANDLTVAQRQKHNGMSWSVSGSSAIAQIKVHFLNDSAIAA